MQLFFEYGNSHWLCGTQAIDEKKAKPSLQLCCGELTKGNLALIKHFFNLEDDF